PAPGVSEGTVLALVDAPPRRYIALAHEAAAAVPSGTSRARACRRCTRRVRTCGGRQRAARSPSTSPQIGLSQIGETGFEPATARPPAGCATRLRHSPLLYFRAGDGNRTRPRSLEGFCAATTLRPQALREGYLSRWPPRRRGGAFRWGRCRPRPPAPSAATDRTSCRPRRRASRPSR